MQKHHCYEATSFQDLTIAVAPTDATLFESAPSLAVDSPASMTLSFKPAANRYGSTLVTVTVANAKTALRTASQFSIEVLVVNDAPTFSLTGDVVVRQGSGAYAGSLVTSVDVGPLEDQTYTLGITCTSTGGFNPVTFNSAPALDTTGTLRFTPEPSTTGTCLCTVTVTDSGGTQNGGVDTATHTFYIRVGAVNHAPTFTLGGDVTVLEDSGSKYVKNWAYQITDGDD